MCLFHSYGPQMGLLNHSMLNQHQFSFIWISFIQFHAPYQAGLELCALCLLSNENKAQKFWKRQASHGPFMQVSAFFANRDWWTLSAVQPASTFRKDSTATGQSPRVLLLYQGLLECWARWFWRSAVQESWTVQQKVHFSCSQWTQNHTSLASG